MQALLPTPNPYAEVPTADKHHATAAAGGQLTTAWNLLQAARKTWTKLLKHCQDAKIRLQSASPGLAHLSTMSCAFSTAVHVMSFTKLALQIHTVITYLHGLR